MGPFATRFIVALTAALALGTNAQGSVLFSWENDAEGWDGIDGFTQDSAGVTQGEYAAVVNVLEFTNIESQWLTEIPEGLVGNDTLLVDLTLADIPDQSWHDVNAWLHLEGTDGDGWFAVSGPGQRLQSGTISFNYGEARPSLTTGDANAVRFHIRMDTAGGWQGGDVYLDNLRAIPEPTSLGLVALGALGLLLRRRR